MTFENISKVEFISSGKSVMLNNAVIIETSSNKQAEFIAYCFNLQQRYDIRKLKEAVGLMEELVELNKISGLSKFEVEQLLKEIKK